MRYANIGDAIAGMLDQHRRGMTDHEYDLHLRRLKRYAGKVEECEDALSVYAEDEANTDGYIKWAKMLAKYQSKLKAELNAGL